MSKVLTVVTQECNLSYLNMLTENPIKRVKYVAVTTEKRKCRFMNIFNRVSNTNIGTSIGKYRSENLTRINDQKFRNKLAVFSGK